MSPVELNKVRSPTCMLRPTMTMYLSSVLHQAPVLFIPFSMSKSGSSYREKWTTCSLQFSFPPPAPAIPFSTSFQTYMRVPFDHVLYIRQLGEGISSVNTLLITSCFVVSNLLKLLNEKYSRATQV